MLFILQLVMRVTVLTLATFLAEPLFINNYGVHHPVFMERNDMLSLQEFWSVIIRTSLKATKKVAFALS